MQLVSHLEQSPTGRRKMRKVDNPNPKHKYVTDSLYLLVEFNKFYKVLGLRYVSMSELCFVYSVWIVSGVGLTSWEIYSHFGYTSESHYRAVKKRMLFLQSKGFIEVVGTGRNSCMVYAPTPYACSVLDSFFGMDSTAG